MEKKNKSFGSVCFKVALFSGIFFALLVSNNAIAASVTLTATDLGNGGVRLSASASFASCKVCDAYGNCHTNNRGSVSIPYRCADSGEGSAECSVILDRGTLHGTRNFTANASDCKGSASDSITTEFDNTPTVSYQEPTGEVEEPFDIKANVVFKPTLQENKGTINAYVRNAFIARKICKTENCSFSYEEETGSLYDLNHGGPYTIIIRAYGGGASAEESGSITVDKTPEVEITSPAGTVSEPFDITGTATFKPTLNEVKGTITLYVRNGFVASKKCMTENCSFSYKEEVGKLFDLNHGGPYEIRMRASGGGIYTDQTKDITVDKTPEVEITSPAGTVSEPFDITGTATFKPTLNEVKGTITLYVRNGFVASKKCMTESCSFSYKEEVGKLFDLNHGGPYEIRMRASGGGIYTDQTKDITVDKTPEVEITSPKGMVTSPFNVTGYATFKPTLNDVKGTIYAYLNGAYLGSKTCSTLSCDYNYQQINGALINRNIGSYTLRFRATGSGATAYATEQFLVTDIILENNLDDECPND
ncbi:hypothetical protein [Desulfogranum japonicum]|uniref:hypothetical protein n=1 Tax=Desulfogranum japonicum TaxID=231447 RepID=UPI00048E9409|nr:hypothetical protein [Desulfogranum japonicum]